MILPILFIANTPHCGRGVFTSERLEAGTTVEIAPVIELNADERLKVEQTRLFDYIFEWGEDLSGAAVALGYVSIYNHKKEANCFYEMDFDFQTISVITNRIIQSGEELCINYNGLEGEDPSWFNVI